MIRSICVYECPDLDPAAIPDFKVATTTSSRQELMNAITSLDIAAVVLNIDADRAIETIISLLEVKPEIGIVGVTDGSNAKSLIEAQRVGCSQFATRPLDPDDLIQALRRAVHPAGNGAQDCETIAVLGATGGAGSTTVACYLGVELASVREEPTAIFDFDLQFGTVVRSFDLDARHTVADLAAATAVDEYILEKTAVVLPPHLQLFARPNSIEEALAIEERAISTILKTATRRYRHVVVDLPHQLSPLTGAAIEACDKLLIVLQLTVPNVDNARRIIEAVTAAGIPEERIALLVNRYRKNVHNCTVDMVEKQLRRQVVGIVPSDYPALGEAIDSGKPLAEYNSVRTAIRDAAVRLTGRSEQAKRKGLALAARHRQVVVAGRPVRAPCDAMR